MANSGSITVLHVDDQPNFTDLTAAYLNSADGQFSFETATSASNGIEILAESDFDCILSDFDMPGLNGIEFLKSVRENHPDLPFILFTGEGSQEVASDALSAGVTDFIPKQAGSHHFELLGNRIKRAVAQYQTEQELDRYKTIVEAIGDTVYTMDADGYYTYVNDAFLQQTGYSRDDIIGEHASKLTKDEYVEEGEAVIRGLLRDEDKRSITWEFERRNAEGEYVPVENHVALLPMDNGEFRGTAGVVRDIRERKERERKLRESEQRYRALFESSSAVILEEDFSQVKDHLDTLRAEVDDLDAYFETNNEALANLMDRVEIINATERAFEYYDAETNAELVENIQDRFTEAAYAANKEIALRIASGETEFRVRTVSELPNGDRKHEMIEVAVPEAYAEDYSRVYLTVTDISNEVERKETLERLQESARQLVRAETPETVAKEVAQAARDLLDFAYPVVRFREGDRLTPAYAVDELRAEAETIPSYQIGENLAGEAFESGEISVYDDVREVDQGENRGETRSVMYVPIGEHGILSVGDTKPAAFDETDRTFVELLASHAQTALDVIEQRESLRRQNQRLEEFASLLTHDLRNPLTVAQGRLELAREEEDSEHLEAVAQAQNRMQTFIEETLSLARAGETIGDTELVDLSEIGKTAWDSSPSENATLEIESNTSIQADRARFQQMLENLYRNAVEHAGDHVTMRMGDLPDGFYVEDEGPGIPKDDWDDVFDLGYSTTEEGTGFGLSIVRDIAEAHGWNINVTKGSDGGARFEFTGVKTE